MDRDCILARLHERCASTDVRAAFAEDPRLASLVESCLGRARELVEQRCTLEAQVWLAGVTAIVEGRLRKRVAVRKVQAERIADLVEELGNDGLANDLARLLGCAATIQPEITSRLLDVTESVL